MKLRDLDGPLGDLAYSQHQRRAARRASDLRGAPHCGQEGHAADLGQHLVECHGNPPVTRTGVLHALTVIHDQLHELQDAGGYQLHEERSEKKNG